MMKKVLIAFGACLFLLSCGQSQKKEDTCFTAVNEYLNQLGSQYAQGEYCIPFCVVTATDTENPEDIRIWGDFWVENYNMAGDTLKSVSGGSHPGCMHVSKADGRYTVTQFDAVGDGSEFEPTAKAIFGDLYDSFIAQSGNEEARNIARAQSILDYAAAHNLDVSYYQDYGWPAVKIK